MYAYLEVTKPANIYYWKHQEQDKKKDSKQIKDIPKTSVFKFIINLVFTPSQFLILEIIHTMRNGGEMKNQRQKPRANNNEHVQKLIQQ